MIVPFSSSTSTVNGETAIFLNSSPTTLSGRMAVPGSSTFTPSALMRMVVFRSVAFSVTPFSSASQRMLASVAMVLLVPVTRSAIVQYFMNTFWVISSFMWKSSLSPVMNN